MKALRLLLIPILCATTLSAACADDPTNSPNNSEESLPLDDFIAKVAHARATALCHSAFECPQFTPPSTVEALGRLGDLDTCTTFFEPQMLLIDFPQIKASITAGRTKYNPTQATKCLEALNADLQTCTTSPESSKQACESTFTPTLSPGTACTTSTECIEGTCQANPAGNTCPGACIKNIPAQKDDPCTESDTTTCTDAPTDAPPYAQLNQPCTSTILCRAGLACTNLTLKDNDIHGTCAPLIQPNQPCQYTGQCHAGFYCTAIDIDTPGTCAPLIQLDQPCNPSTTQESQTCTIGTRCLLTPQETEFTCQNPNQSPQICEI